MCVDIGRVQYSEKEVDKIVSYFLVFSTTITTFLNAY